MDSRAQMAPGFIVTNSNARLLHVRVLKRINLHSKQWTENSESPAVVRVSVRVTELTELSNVCRFI